MAIAKIKITLSKSPNGDFAVKGYGEWGGINFTTFSIMRDNATDQELLREMINLSHAVASNVGAPFAQSGQSAIGSAKTGTGKPASPTDFSWN